MRLPSEAINEYQFENQKYLLYSFEKPLQVDVEDRDFLKALNKVKHGISLLKFKAVRFLFCSKHFCNNSPSMDVMEL